ncbi:hypothetical protein PY254_13785 [Rhodanobacter sp. AS-Z3]|uniref:Tse2 family ADP-ribosyltransferase toxin n=1 Tax=Rhodanobacter sp. AS-Z3 TaxID=3031330 RepID=UPI002478D4B6|nr:hypothetical protein [Rhodanobacter sp. AS-Z3]WEN14300.1 hypothetical protein PY254_13785 [Rhodanobacter sp. AS-Z3]
MSNIELDLYRSCKSRDWGTRKASDSSRSKEFLAADGKTSLHPNYGFTRTDGSERPSDVTRFSKDGKTWVRGVEDIRPDGKHWVSWKEGVSVGSNKQAMPYSKGWFDFLLPKGTSIPASLDVKPTPSRSNPDHYSIRLKNQLTQEAYQDALDTLARNAIAKAVELGIPSHCFS